jgi:aspartate carbamoyltransferase regulatory subunit
MNADSKKLGKKDIIKIETKMELDYTVLGFIDPNITIDVIENSAIREKIKLSLPDRVENVMQCKNPRCITFSGEIYTSCVLPCGPFKGRIQMHLLRRDIQGIRKLGAGNGYVD